MRNNLGRIILLVVVVAAIGAYFAFDLGQYLSLAELRARRDTLAELARNRPVLFIGSYFVIYVVTTALSLPGAAILTIAGGTVLGLTVGTITVSFASSIGATLAFLAARFLFCDSVRRRFKERLKPIDEGVERDGGFYLFSLRLVPIFPFFVINLVAGRTHIQWRIDQTGRPDDLFDNDAGLSAGSWPNEGGQLTIGDRWDRDARAFQPLGD